MFRLEDPAALLLAAALPAIVAVWLARRRRRAAVVIPSLGAARGLPIPRRAKLRKGLVVLRCLALVLLAAAIARPQSLGRPEYDTADAVDLFLVLDVSSSMASQDFQPLNRLEVAKRVISRFVDARAGDRLGLISFARFSSLRCPLTLDHDVLDYQLQNTQMAEGADDGTAIGMAIATSVNHLRRSPAKSRVVVLLTDGENNRSTIDPGTGTELARVFGVKVYTIGVGRQPADTSDDPFAQPQRAGFNEEALRQIADATGGKYYRAGDVDALSSIFSEIDSLERSPVRVPVYSSVTERFRGFAVAAFLLAALEVLLRLVALARVP